MEANTTLKLTLTSPGTTPSPTPTPTPTTTTTTTVVGSPNTGDNTNTDTNVGGTVFASIFAAILLAALTTFAVKYFKKNRTLRFSPKGSFHIAMSPRRVVIGSALVLAIAFLGSSIFVQTFTKDETQAAERTSVAVSVTSEMTFDADRGQTAYLTDSVRVASTTSGYDLYVHTTDDKFRLNDTSTTSYFSSTLGSYATSDYSAIGTNQWGMSLNTSDVSTEGWFAVPTTSTNIKSTSTANADGDATTVYYGINVGSDMPDGTYYGHVIYTALAKETGYQVTTVRGYVGTTGTTTNARFNDGVEVVIRSNCPADTRFIGWEFVGLTVQDNLADPLSFIMPANNVVATANCLGEDEDEEIVIVYNKNNTNATGTTADTKTTRNGTPTLTANGFKLTGYTFKGWACKANATSAAYTDKQTIASSRLISACGIDETQDTPTITLYAIWEPDAITYLQEMTPERCDSMAYFEVVTLKDRRDDQNYSFTKYADGRCWMLKDLDYRPTGSTALTAADTDISSDRTVSFATSGTSGAVYHTQKTQDKTSGINTKDNSTLYNFQAATGGYWSSATKSANTIIPDSLCPANWKMPDASHGPTFNEATQTVTNDKSYGTNSGEFYGLWNYNVGAANGYGKTATNTWKLNFIFGSGEHTINSKTVTYPYFTYNGSWSFSAGTWADTSKGTSGKYASYFLSTLSTNNSGTVVPAAYNPHAPGVDTDTSDINVTDPAHGSSVRCVLRLKEQITDRTYAGGSSDKTD